VDVERRTLRELHDVFLLLDRALGKKREPYAAPVMEPGDRSVRVVPVEDFLQVRELVLATHLLQRQYIRVEPPDDLGEQPEFLLIPFPFGLFRFRPASEEVLYVSGHGPKASHPVSLRILCVVACIRAPSDESAMNLTVPLPNTSFSLTP